MIVHAIIKPGSKKGPLLVPYDEHTLLIYVREPAIEGRANAAAIVLLAKHYGVPKGHVVLQKGATARYKTFEIQEQL